LADADRARDARWRFQQHNGDWWYWTPNNTWMYRRDGNWNRYAADTFTPNPTFQGQYAAGFRGEATAFDPAQMVFVDSGGRAVICQSGRVAFMDGTALRTVHRNQINEQGFFIGQAAVQGQFAPGQSGFRATNQAQFQQGATIQQSQAQLDADARARLNAQGQTPIAQGQVNAQSPANVPGQNSAAQPQAAQQPQAAPTQQSAEATSQASSQDQDVPAAPSAEEASPDGETPGAASSTPTDSSSDADSTPSS
jgi:hypothetical protein